MSPQLYRCLVSRPLLERMDVNNSPVDLASTDPPPGPMKQLATALLAIIDRPQMPEKAKLLELRKKIAKMTDGPSSHSHLAESAGRSVGSDLQEFVPLLESSGSRVGRRSNQLLAGRRGR